MLYSEIKTAVQAVFGSYVKNGGFVESDSGSPSELAVLLHMVHSRVVAYPREYDFLLVPETITSTGATSYNLKTLFPDLLSVSQIWGLDVNRPHTHVGRQDGNFTEIRGWYVKNKVLYFSGAVPTTGTIIKLDYKSQYMVLDSSGNRKKYFTEDDDESVLDEADINVLIMGLSNYVNWKVDEVSQNKRAETIDWFSEAWTNLTLRDDVSTPIDSLL